MQISIKRKKSVHRLKMLTINHLPLVNNQSTTFYRLRIPTRLVLYERTCRMAGGQLLLDHVIEVHSGLVEQ